MSGKAAAPEGARSGSSPFAAKEDRNQEYRSGPGRAVRPREASTLILIRRDEGAPKVLMGQRSANHKFMPNKFVFPGGRLDVADTRIRPAEDLHERVTARLLDRMRGRPSENKARGLALAAIRETFEETGLVLGRKAEAPPKTRNAAWAAYYNEGVVPTLARLEFIARAITPPYRTRRFDTRFFMADAEDIVGEPHETTGSGELLKLHWLTVNDARDLDLPNITRMVLGELEERLKLTDTKRHERAVPFVHFRRGKPIQDTL